MSKERNCVGLQKEKKKKSRLTTKAGVGWEMRSLSELSSTPQNGTRHLNGMYRVLGETKVVIQEFYILPSYHSCTKAGKKKTFPEIQRLGWSIFYFYFLSAQSCLAEKLPRSMHKPLTTALWTSAGHISHTQVNQATLRTGNGPLRDWSRKQH